jgi:1,4-dihydroxy-2-naphthoate octaprenyltransferase
MARVRFFSKYDSIIIRGKALISKTDYVLKIIRLGRLKLPLLAFLLFLFGVLLAVISGVSFALDRFLLGSAITLTAVLSENYGNDYFDVEVDRYSKRTAFSGGSGVLQENPELMVFAKRFALAMMSLSIVLAMLFTVVFSFPIFFVFVVVGNLLGWFYAAPPLSLSYRGFSEIATVVAVGLMLPSSGFLVLKASFDLALGVFALPCMLYALVFIICVEIPDMESDQRGNKNTLIVRKGRKFGFTLMAVSVSLASLWFLLVQMINFVHLPVDFRLIILLSLLPLFPGIRGLVRRTDDIDIATKLVSHEISALTIYLMIMNCYLSILARTVL